MSATKIGFNFRSTSGYVTDGTDQTYVVSGSSDYPQTRGGWTFGRVSGNQFYEDISTSVDVRLAGELLNNTGTVVFQIDLPAAGDYKFRLAMGYLSGGTFPTCLIKDGSTTLATIVDSGGIAAGSFMDATQATHTAANWPGSNTQTAALTFSGTTCNFEMSCTFGPGFAWAVAHIEVEQQGGGAVGQPTSKRFGGVPFMGTGGFKHNFGGNYWRTAAGLLVPQGV